MLPITVRNLGDETLAVTAAEICRPNGSKMAIDSQGLFGFTPAFNPPEERGLKITVKRYLHGQPVMAG